MNCLCSDKIIMFRVSSESNWIFAHFVWLILRLQFCVLFINVNIQFDTVSYTPAEKKKVEWYGIWYQSCPSMNQIFKIKNHLRPLPWGRVVMEIWYKAFRTTFISVFYLCNTKYINVKSWYCCCMNQKWLLLVSHTWKCYLLKIAIRSNWAWRLLFRFLILSFKKHFDNTFVCFVYLFLIFDLIF